MRPAGVFAKSGIQLANSFDRASEREEWCLLHPLFLSPRSRLRQNTSTEQFYCRVNANRSVKVECAPERPLGGPARLLKRGVFERAQENLTLGRGYS